jgi:hypothetical protein
MPSTCMTLESEEHVFLYKLEWLWTKFLDSLVYPKLRANTWLQRVVTVNIHVEVASSHRYFPGKEIYQKIIIQRCKSTSVHYLYHVLQLKVQAARVSNNNILTMYSSISMSKGDRCRPVYPYTIKHQVPSHIIFPRFIVSFPPKHATRRLS